MLNKESRVIAVSVCVNYDDMLSLVVENNIQYLKEWYIVTDLTDNKTIALCKKYNLKCIKSDNWKNKKHDTINKPIFLNKGLKKAFKYKAKRDWILILDADIYLTDTVMTYVDINIKTKTFNKEAIYWSPRIFIPEYSTFKILRNSNFNILDIVSLIKTNDIYEDEHEIYGAGYFQLFYNELYYDETKLNDFDLKHRDIMHNLMLKNKDDLALENTDLLIDYDTQNYNLADIDFSEKFELLNHIPYKVFHIGNEKINWSKRITNRWIE